MSRTPAEPPAPATPYAARVGEYRSLALQRVQRGSKGSRSFVIPATRADLHKALLGLCEERPGTGARPRAVADLFPKAPPWNVATNGAVVSVLTHFGRKGPLRDWKAARFQLLAGFATAEGGWNEPVEVEFDVGLIHDVFSAALTDFKKCREIYRLLDKATPARGSDPSGALVLRPAGARDEPDAFVKVQRFDWEEGYYFAVAWRVDPDPQSPEITGAFKTLSAPITTSHFLERLGHLLRFDLTHRRIAYSRTATYEPRRTVVLPSGWLDRAQDAAAVDPALARVIADTRKALAEIRAANLHNRHAMMKDQSFAFLLRCRGHPNEKAFVEEEIREVFKRRIQFAIMRGQPGGAAAFGKTYSAEIRQAKKDGRRAIRLEEHEWARKEW